MIHHILKQKHTSYQINCTPYINCYWLAISGSSRTTNSWPYVGCTKKPIRDFPVFLGCADIFHSRKSPISPACSAHHLLSFSDLKIIFPPQQFYLQACVVLSLVKADPIAPVIGHSFPCWFKCGVWLFSSMGHNGSWELHLQWRHKASPCVPCVLLSWGWRAMGNTPARTISSHWVTCGQHSHWDQSIASQGSFTLFTIKNFLRIQALWIFEC